MSDEKDTFTYVTLCSVFNDEMRVVCDEPKGHQGAHRASVFWLGDEEEVLEDVVEDS